MISYATYMKELEVSFLIYVSYTCNGITWEVHTKYYHENANSY